MFRGARLQLALAACLLVGLFTGRALAQGLVTSIGFRNELKIAVIIQGTSKVNNMIRRGQPIVIPPGKMGGDFPVPPGLRVYSVYDANQPSRVLARDVPVTAVPGRIVTFSIRSLPNGQVALVPD